MIVSFIPARGGSKGVPRKNIRLLGGKPLICHTIEAALASKSAAFVFVSTEDPEIAGIAAAAGARIIDRPQSLAEDSTPSLPVILHALPLIENLLGEKIEILALLQATTPFRNGEDIDRTVHLLIKSNADSAVSVTPVQHGHPSKIKRMEQDRLHPYLENEPEGVRRQDLAPAYIRNGGVYATRRETLLAKNSLYGNDCRGYVMPVERSIEIDSPLDFSFAEWWFSRESNHS